MSLYTPKALRTNWVYIMTNVHNTTFYTGSTSDIAARIGEHKHKNIKGFTQKYNLTKLVWFEQQVDMETALLREARIKRWRREWKVELIKSINPELADLYEKAALDMAFACDY